MGRKKLIRKIFLKCKLNLLFLCVISFSGLTAAIFSSCSRTTYISVCIFSAFNFRQLHALVTRLFKQCTINRYCAVISGPCCAHRGSVWAFVITLKSPLLSKISLSALLLISETPYQAFQCSVHCHYHLCLYEDSSPQIHPDPQLRPF